MCHRLASDEQAFYSGLRPSSHKSKHRGKSREIPLGPRAIALLGPFLKADPDAFPFSTREARAARRGLGRYRDTSYRTAVAKGCEKAGVPRWHPNQLRHTAATPIRARFGLEASQVVLGHSKADTTQIYALRDQELAVRVMKEIG